MSASFFFLVSKFFLNARSFSLYSPHAEIETERTARVQFTLRFFDFSPFSGNTMQSNSVNSRSASNLVVWSDVRKNRRQNHSLVWAFHSISGCFTFLSASLIDQHSIGQREPLRNSCSRRGFFFSIQWRLNNACRRARAGALGSGFVVSVLISLGH